MVIPDVQLKPGQDLGFLRAIGEYMIEKKPDTVILLGDFGDMPSLSSYDMGKKSFEGRRYRADIEVVHAGLDALFGPLKEYNQRARKNRKKVYDPRRLITLGNHENRIERVVEDDPKFDGTISIQDLRYEDFGLEVYPYREVVFVDGIAYTHVFTTGAMGRPVSNARLLVNKKHMSCVQGHNQKMEIYNEYRADGKSVIGLFAGCCYEHDEAYLGPQGNDYFRGIHMLYDVNDGNFHCHSITLNYLLDRAKRRLHTGEDVLG